MGKINLLTSKVFNRISAGEVVERPFSVVKELVENAIDAKATKIDIKIENGGISLIEIIDNGSGIEKDDLSRAILPHATSKICTVKDLDAIKTLGFRGEALASIASVSKLSIISKTLEQDCAYKLYVEGGDVSEIEESAGEIGTVMTVKNLFFNTPAREKFLRTPRSEEGDITATVSRFILGNPDIAFTYYVDNKLVLQSYGDGVESAFISIYEAKTLKDCFLIDSEKNGVKIYGYIGKHYFTKANRSHQTIFINGRVVVNNTISSAIANAYSSYLMKRQYPFCVLYLTVPNEIVDVNVHPNKLDVRFSNNQIIYSAVYSILSKTLDGASEALDIVVDKNQSITNERKDDYVRHNTILPNIESKNKEDKIGVLNFSDISEEKNKNIEDIFLQNKAYLESLETKKKEIQVENIVQNVIKVDKELKYIGQALNTFLIFEDGEDLYFIDQHAAHERVLYDKFIEDFKSNNNTVQPLLIDYILNVSTEEFEFISEKVSFLTQLGFSIEEFGRNSYKISTVPTLLSNINLKNFFDELLFDFNSLKKIEVEDLLLEKISQKACKAAIKSGDKMSDGEVEYLLKLIKGNLGLKCPHGRPIAIKISRTEIDKWFKRIV